ncbi:MAG TPA: HAMP domain-containing sensor histidine kinase [bacterium]|nr:HAMP domain-containing sensor histidine kinase [bacterium]
MRRLYTRIYLHFVGLLLIMTVAATVIGSLVLRGPVLHGFAAHVATHAARLVAERMGDPERLAASVAHLSREFEVDITIRDATGTVVTANGKEQPVPSARDLERMKEGPVVLSRTRIFCLATRIVDASSGDLIGVLEISPRERFASFSPIRPLLGFALVLGIVAVGVAPLARRISRPVDSLIEATQRFGDGDLSWRIPLPAWCTDPDAQGRRHRMDQLTRLTVSWNDMAGRVEKLVGGHRELLANVSHELRSPLARLRVALELLPKSSDTETRIAEIEGDLTELERLIDDVLTTSRLEASGFPLHPEAVDVAGLFAQLRERAGHDPLLSGKEIRLSGADAIVVRADAPLLKRALWNLLENAGKYGAPPLSLSAATQDGMAVFSVSDEGPGIPVEEREKVLAPFYRVDKARTPSASGAPQGFGLGLTLARRIAEAHGGTLRIESVHPDGRGCRVVLALPLARAA